jgi:hypothetical protein
VVSEHRAQRLHPLRALPETTTSPDQQRFTTPPPECERSGRASQRSERARCDDTRDRQAVSSGSIERSRDQDRRSRHRRAERLQPDGNEHKQAAVLVHEVL